MARTIAEVSSRCDVFDERLSHLQKDAEDLWAGDQKLLDQLQAIRTELSEFRRELAVLRQRTDESDKRADEWGRRLWALIPIFLSALLALASGLVITLARKSPP